MLHDKIREHLLRGINFDPVGHKTEDLAWIMGNQWSEEFIGLMRSRMLMGFFRYGDVKSAAGAFDNIGSAIHRLKLFRRTGNEEHTVDAANLCMIEFMQKNHPNAHFEAADDGYHTEKLK